MLTADQAQILASNSLQELEMEIPLTRKIVNAVPEDQLDYKPGEKGMTARELMWHLVTSDVWFAQGVMDLKFGTEDPGPAPRSKAEMLAFHDRVQAIVEGLKTRTGEHMATPVQFYMYNLPAVSYLSFWTRHSVHHRGQLSAYLRGMNARVPAIYGGSADEPMETGASA